MQPARILRRILAGIVGRILAETVKRILARILTAFHNILLRSHADIGGGKSHYV